MSSPTIQHRIDAGESKTQEFKSTFDKACIKTLVAFANATGGRVLVGVSDNGVVQGTTIGKESLNPATAATGGVSEAPQSCAIPLSLLKTSWA